MNPVLKVLMVEDNKYDVELIVNTIASHGYDVRHRVVLSAEEFRNELTKNYDLIIADHGLPKFSSTEALAIRNRLCPDTPFIIVSGLISETQAVDAIQNGASDYLLKDRLARLGASIKVNLTRVRRANETKAMHNQLALSEQRYRALVENIKDYAVIGLSSEGEIIMWSQGAEAVLGFSKAQMLGKSFGDLYCDYGPNGDRLRSLLDEATKCGRVEHQDPLKNSHDKCIVGSIIATPHLENSAVIGFSVVVRDITKSVEIDIERQKLLTQENAARKFAEEALVTAEQHNRLKDEFLGILSHELRTPLSAILGWSEILQSMDLSATARRDAVSRISRNAWAQLRMIEDLLDISRTIAGQIPLDIGRINLKEVLEDAIDSIKVELQIKQLSLKITVDESLKEFEFVANVDGTRLRQIACNLLSNACKFSFPGGVIEVNLEQVQDGVVLRIKDYGEGFRPEFVSRMFDRFTQGDSSFSRRHGGLGIGLAVTKHFVELHGGTISAESPGINQGATFKVNLPGVLSQAAIQTSGEGQHMTEAPLRQTYLLKHPLHILVVEDDATTLAYLKCMLENFGARVNPASSAETALKILYEENSLDAMFCDIGLPEMDGYQLIKKIRDDPRCFNRSIPSFALTAFASDEHKKRALNAGFNYFLTKPIRSEKLFAKLSLIQTPELQPIDRSTTLENH